MSDVRLGRQRSPQHHTGTHMRPYMRAANVGWGGLRLDDVKTMNFTDHEMKTFRLCPGDLLLSEASGTATEVGKPAIWNGEVEDCGFQNTLIRVRSHGPEPRYLLHYFMHQAGTGQFAANSRGVGIHHLGRETLASWLVPLPLIDEQRRIVAVLDKADELRAKRRAVLDQLDTITASIFLEMFGDPALNMRGWASAPLESLAAGRDGIKCGPFGTQLGKEEYQDSGVPLWGIRQVNAGFMIETAEYLTEAKANDLSGYDLVGGDIVMTRKGTVGNCAVYPSSFPPGVMHSDLLRVRLNSLADAVFVSFQLRHSREVTRQISLISGGAIDQVSHATSRICSAAGRPNIAPPLACPATIARSSFGTCTCDVSERSAASSTSVASR